MSTVFLVAQQFASGVIQISPLGNGLINDTYLVATHTSSFVLQRINLTVFNLPEQIMENLGVLNQHISQKDAALVRLKMPELLKTSGNNSFYKSENGDCWRAISYIANTDSFESISTLRDAEQAGFALGHFHRLVSDLDPVHLYDTLPGFHIAPDYLKHHHQILSLSVQRQNDFCADFISGHCHITNDLEAAKDQGELSLRVIHGDPKLNNFLFDKGTRNIVSLIDLDTVKPGLVHYDIGDCLRSCCYKSDPVRFDLDICAALLKSYLVEVGEFFTEYDYNYLYPAIRLIPFELGLRFYTDYLHGNQYFKVIEPEQNLSRAIDQFELCASIVSQEASIRGLISQLQNNSTALK